MVNYIDLIKENSEVSDYKVNKANRKSFELFFVHDKLETIRSTDTTDTDVVVYVDHKKFRGDYKFSVSSTDTIDSIRSKIQEAVILAKAIDNKHYDLPKDIVSDDTVETNFTDYSAQDLGTKIYECLKECSDASKATLNATEIFINKDTVEFENSNGVSRKQVIYNCMIETIPTFDKKTSSVEIYENIKFSIFDPAKLKKKIKQALKDVKSRASAKKPKEEIICNVLFRSKEIYELIGTLANQLNYGSILKKMNVYNVGDKFQVSPKGDYLNVTMCGQIKQSANSSFFDDDGVSLTKQKVIKNGVAYKGFGSNQYAKWLHKKVTGKLRLIELKKGTMTEKEMKSKPYLECASLSGLQVDVVNNYIGGEIRLAYYFDGEKVKPITGISISGKLDNVLNVIRLSNKLTYDTSYKGPTLALIEGMKIM